MPLRHWASALAGRISPARVGLLISVGCDDDEVVQRLEDRWSGRVSSNMCPPYSPEMPESPFVELEVGSAHRQGDESGQGLLPRARRDEARPRPVLPLGRRGDRARAVRAADAAEAAPGRRRGRGDLPEARAEAPARLDRDRDRHLPLRPHRRRALRHRACAGRVGRESRHDRLPSLAVAAARRRAPRRAPHRRRPAARHGLRARRSRSRRSSSETLDELGFVGWPKTSGNRGIHVACRIEPNWGFREVRRCALAFAREIERRAPKLVTTAWWKEERGERVFIDYNQNARDRTIASAYSVRARPDATVSAPFRWEELDDLETEDFTLATMPGRYAELGDVQAGHRRRRLRPAQAVRVGRARGGGGSGRGSVPAELPEDAGRAEARPAVAREEDASRSPAHPSASSHSRLAAASDRLRTGVR